MTPDEKFNEVKMFHEIDLYLACNLAAKQANLEIEERHMYSICYYMSKIMQDFRRNPEYYYQGCIRQVLKDEEELTTMFVGKFLK